MRNPKFIALLKTMQEVHERKNQDYSKEGDPLSNFKLSGMLAEGFKGMDASFAVLIGVKIARLQELLGKGKAPQNESVQDTLLDLAVYAALWASSYGVGAPEEHGVGNMVTAGSSCVTKASMDYLTNPSATVMGVASA